jgi:hypothetical protein
MYKAIVALAAATAIAASFAPAALACVDGAPCPPRIPAYKQYIPKGVPGVPNIPKGEIPNPPPIPKGLPKPPPKPSQQKAPKKVEDADASRTAPKASESDVKVVEKPASVSTPKRAPVCTRYLPSLGKAVEIPCE